MPIDCVECGTPISAENLDLGSLLARCRRCNAVFSFAEKLGRKPPPAPPVPRRPEVPLPRSLEVRRSGKDLVLRRRWFTWAVLPILLFTVFWDGFMVMWYAIAFSQGQWGMALFGTLHAAVGVMLAYASLAGLLNATSLAVSAGRLQVRHGPLPWPGEHDVDARDIDQLYVKCCPGGDGLDTFELHAILGDQAHVKLVDALSESEQALFLEQQLEAFLGIEDRHVADELERPGGPYLRLPDREGRPALPSVIRRTPSAGGAAVDDEPLPEDALALAGVEPGELVRCPVCGERVVDERETCPRCATVHHPECWRYSGGCATYGCGS